MSNVAAQARTASIHSFAAIDSRTYNDGWPFSGVSGQSTYTWLFGSETGVTAMCYDVPPQQLLRLGVIPSDLMATEHEAAMASTGASLGMDADVRTNAHCSARCQPPVLRSTVGFLPIPCPSCGSGSDDARD